MSLAFLFPGQGSQAVGMGADLAEAFAAAREVFQEVDDALRPEALQADARGPEDQLTLTENAQPALMAVSLAVMRTLEQEFGVGVDKAAFVAGHSLGEYSALAAAGAISLADTARLLKLRGQAMQRAVPVGAGRHGLADRAQDRRGAGRGGRRGRRRGRRLRRGQRQQRRQCGDLRRQGRRRPAPSRRPRSWARGRSR